MRRPFDAGELAFEFIDCSPTVVGSTSTVSCSLVSFRRGVGILIFYCHAEKGLGLFRFDFLVGLDQLLKLAQARLDLSRLAKMPLHGIERFEAVASDAEHDGILGRNLA
ncbi:MAG: hypothetical protein Ct9H300mP32_1800 [Verrucomicrobiota bacterium]|nr:MAG: hypothetical protein Ct9H300mP32_1800 [Verrucomicrobiota bacterium]